MARDPRSRHELQHRLEELLGEEAAQTLMEALPPHSWDELATKADLLAVKADVEAVKADVGLLRLGFEHLDAKIDRLDERWGERLEASEHRIMAAFRGELNTAITAQTRTIVFSLLGSLIATGSLIIAASHFA